MQEHDAVRGLRRSRAQQDHQRENALHMRSDRPDEAAFTQLAVVQAPEQDERRQLMVSTARTYAKRLEVERFKSAQVFLKELFLFLRESREARA